MDVCTSIPVGQAGYGCSHPLDDHGKDGCMLCDCRRPIVHLSEREAKNLEESVKTTELQDKITELQKVLDETRELEFQRWNRIQELKEALLEKDRTIQALEDKIETWENWNRERPHMHYRTSPRKE